MKSFSFLGLFATAIAMAFIVAPAGAAEVQAVANFDGGGTDAAPVTDVIDAYTGMAGGNWAEGWYKYTNNSIYTVGTTNASPLSTGGGNYLDFTMTPLEGTTGRYDSVSRSYATDIDVTQSHSVDFMFRVNEDLSDPVLGYFNTSNDRYQLFDAPTHDQGNGGPNCSWLISCYGGAATWLDASKAGHWVLFNGANDNTAASDAAHIDTGIIVTQNTVYDFHIDIDAVTKTYDVTISSGGTTLYDSTTSGFADGLGWRTNAAATPGLPHFGAFGNDPSDTRLYSLDNVKVIGMGFGPYGGLSTVLAHFTGGNSNTVVDGYEGMPGDGWKTAWQVSALRADLTASVETTSPINGGGAYLQTSIQVNEPENLGRAAVARDYKTTADPGIDWSDKHSVKFTVRIDENTIGDPFNDTFTGYNDRYWIYDAPELLTGTNEDCTWMVFAYAADGEYIDASDVGQWCFYDGLQQTGPPDPNQNVATGIDIVAGGVYEFTIIVDPETHTYDATVSNGAESFTITDLGWRSAALGIGGNLHFGAVCSDELDTRAFSLDELVISQTSEPTIPGDTNGDNKVDANDATVLAQNWGTDVGTGGFAMGDFNGDEVVNAADAAILAANWGNHNPPQEAAASVPEPSIMVLLLASALLLLVGRRRN